MGLLDFFTDADHERINAELKELKEKKKIQDAARIAEHEAQYVEASDAAILATIHPIPRTMVRNTLIKAKQSGLKLGINMGGRTVELQDELYHKGRKLVNGIWVEIDPIHHTGVVTNAPGGKSWHNYFCAVDLVMDGSPKPGYQYTWQDFIDANGDGVNDWNQLGVIGESFGLTWGGRWRPPQAPIDVPHFQYHTGISMVSDALRLYQEGGLANVWEHIV